MRGAVSLAAGVAMIVAVSMSPASACQGPPHPATSVLYTASDFPALARGVDHGLSHEAPRFPGKAAVSVWAPSQDEWSLTAGDDGTITLKLRSRPGDATPSWQSLGTINLAEHRPFKVVVSHPEEKEKSGSTEKAKAKKRNRARCPRCCD